MSDHHHHHHHDQACTHGAAPLAAVEMAEKIAAERQLNMTPMRRDVLRILAASPKPLGAYDIIAALPDKKGRKPAPILVYRALDFLTESGFVHRIQSSNAFFACVHAHKPDELVVLMVCEACGCAHEYEDPDIRKNLDQLALKEGFAPSRRMVEVFGRCAHCKE